MNWKEKIKEIAQHNSIDFDSFTIKGEDYGLKHDANNLLVSMIEFAKLACEEQKKICYEHAEIDEDSLDYADDELNVCPNSIDISKSSILNAPTVNFD